MAHHEYKAFIYDNVDTNTEYEVPQAFIRTAPAIGGQRVEVSQGTVLARPWSIDISDAETRDPNLTTLFTTVGSDDFVIAGSSNLSLANYTTGGFTGYGYNVTAGDVYIALGDNEVNIQGIVEAFVRIEDEVGSTNYTLIVNCGRDSVDGTGQRIGVNLFMPRPADVVDASLNGQGVLIYWLRRNSGEMDLYWEERNASGVPVSGPTELAASVSFDTSGTEDRQFQISVNGNGDVTIKDKQKDEPDSALVTRATLTAADDFAINWQDGAHTYAGLFGLRGSVGASKPQFDDLSIVTGESAPFLSSKLFDSDGRYTLIGRLLELQRSVDGGAFNTVGFGRVDAITDHVSHYTFQIQDERWKEQARLFTQQNTIIGNGSSDHYNGTVLMPAGPLRNYLATLKRSPLGLLGEYSSTDGNLACIRVDVQVAEDRALWHNGIIDLITADLQTEANVNPTSTHGNFTHLRAVVATSASSSGFEMEIQTFDTIAADETFPDRAASTITDQIHSVPFLRVWVQDSTGQLAGLSLFDPVYLYLYAPTAPPNRYAPLHLTNVPPFTLVRDVYDQLGVRYSSGAMQTLIDDPFFRPMHFRITKPVENARTWLDEHIFVPLAVAPVMQTSDGKIAPFKLHLPADVNPATLPEYTEAEVSAPHPDWTQSGRDQVTKLVWKYTITRGVVSRTTDGDWSADLIDEDEGEFEIDHDRLTEGTARERRVTRNMRGYHQLIIGQSPRVARGIAEVLSQEFFHRFGDAPVTGRALSAMGAAPDVTVGEYFRLSVPTWPSSSGRGGTRLLQAVGQRFGEDGAPVFDYLDSGKSQAGLATPTLTAKASTGRNPQFFITIQPSGTTEQLHVQVGRGSTEPGTTGWLDHFGVFDGSTDFDVGPMASNTTHWFRARATKANRIRSAWSTAISQATCSIPPPGMLGAAIPNSRTAALTFEPGDLSFPLDFRLEVGATSDAAVSTDAQIIGRLDPQSKEFLVEGLNEDSTHRVGVRHYDPYGGFSESIDLTLSTPTSAHRPTAPGVGRLSVLAGTTAFIVKPSPATVPVVAIAPSSVTP